MDYKVNTSQVKIVRGLSPIALAAAGSGTAIDATGYEWGMLLAIGGSTPTGTGLVLGVERSATSNGTFAQFGASIPHGNTNNTVTSRSFAIDTSAVWHKISYDNNNLGSAITGVALLLFSGRNEPVPTQATGTTGYSDVL